MPHQRSYDVAPDWVLPDLTDLVPDGGRIAADVTTLRTSYVDTADRALHRRGIRVTVGGGTCTVRIGDDEFRVDAPGRGVPATALALLRGVRGGGRLVAVARSDTMRGVTAILDDTGTTLAEIVDDAVTATALDLVEVTEQRREVTLTAGDEALSRRLHKVIKAAGGRRVTRPDTEPLLALTSLTAEAHAPQPAARSLGGLITEYLRAQHDALLVADVELRRGQDVVHAARVATRRYRSVLRVFADVLDTGRSTALDTELQWFAGQLGAVRDLEVQRVHLAAAVGELSPDLVLGPVAERIDTHLRAQQLAARARLDRTMRGRRYLALLAELEQWHDHPPLTDRADRGRKAVTGYLHGAERALTKRLRAVEHGDDDTLHRARKAAKRARYTAELATPALGKAARHAVTRSKRLQDELGEFQDSVVACGILLRLGATAARAGESGFTYGVLHRAERDRADHHRARAVRAAHG